MLHSLSAEDRGTSGVYLFEACHRDVLVGSHDFLQGRNILSRLHRSGIGWRIDHTEALLVFEEAWEAIRRLVWL